MWHCRKTCILKQVILIYISFFHTKKQLGQCNRDLDVCISCLGDSFHGFCVLKYTQMNGGSAPFNGNLTFYS